MRVILVVDEKENYGRGVGDKVLVLGLLKRNSKVCSVSLDAKTKILMLIIG